MRAAPKILGMPSATIAASSRAPLESRALRGRNTRKEPEGSTDFRGQTCSWELLFVFGIDLFCVFFCFSGWKNGETKRERTTRRKLFLVLAETKPNQPWGDGLKRKTTALMGLLFEVPCFCVQGKPTIWGGEKRRTHIC